MSGGQKIKKRKNYKYKKYHAFYKRKGVYAYFFKNLVKVLIGMGVLLLILFLFQYLVPDFNAHLEAMLTHFKPISILIVFFISESILGLIPPDIFIIWAQNFTFPYAMVALLAFLSYVGGAVSYLIGTYIGKIPAVEIWLNRKFESSFDQIKKWGGVLIVFAALFPLPFSPVCMAAGTIRFPLTTFFILGTFRFVRFFLYAVVLYTVI
ncbi:MAG: short-chain dehydrogenase [Vicingaceae bacterium]